MSYDAEDIKRAEADFNAATVTLHKCVPGAIGISNDKAYAAAYQALVRMGQRPQLKRKYRGGS